MPNSIEKSIDHLFTMDSYEECLEALGRGEQVKISKEIYCHFMDILPPRTIGAGFFTFQEGDGDIIYFSECEDSYSAYMKKLGIYHEETTSGYLFHLSFNRNNYDANFCLTDAYICGFNVPKHIEEFMNSLIGKSYSDLTSIKNEVIEMLKRNPKEVCS